MNRAAQNRQPILVVDDEAANCDLLKRVLERDGHGVAVARSGQAALERLFSPPAPVDLVLLDLRMPGMNGIETLREIRKQYSASELPVIVVSAEGDSGTMVDALDCGANDYVTKPVQLPVLSARVRAQLALARADRSLRDSEQRYKLAVRGSNDGVWDLDTVSGYLEVDARWREMLGYGEGELPPTVEAWNGLLHPEDRVRLLEATNAHCARQTPNIECECRVKHKDGTWRWVLIRGMAVWDAEGNVIRVAGSQTDVTEGRVHDPLTGLSNQLLFREQVTSALDEFRQSSRRPFAIFLLNLDHFKLINDSLGHRAGDLVLTEAARRLASCARSGRDLAARVRGDEFAILLTDVGSPGDVSELARRVLSEINRPMSIADHELVPKASLGIAVVSADTADADELIHNADTAMHAAKASREGSFAIFDSAMREAALDRFSFEEDLRDALYRNELSLEFQPQVNLDTGRITGFEALLRWKHPRRGYVGPAEFIPVAEATGLMVPIGAWALREAAGQLAAWRSQFPAETDLAVSVNVSGPQLAAPGFRELLVEIAREAQVPPRYLKLELTESIFLDPQMAVTLEEVRALGFPLKMDDFGTGYCSLGYFQTTRFDAVKIDRSFVTNIDTSREALEIASAIVSLARTLQMKVIAEGVETESQARKLLSIGCHFGQGFLFSKPVPASVAGRLIADQQCAARALAPEATTQGQPPPR